jgi:ferric-dicitrate binding protein FerR (iron transport regulator)
MKSLDRQSLDEQTRLVSRYVAGDLSRSERAEFEAWLVASPELAAEVEMERRMRRGISSAARRGWLRRGAPVVAPAHDRRWRMAVAASVVIALVTLGISVLVPVEKQEPAGTRLAATTTRHLGPARTIRLSAMRGGLGTSPDIAVSRVDAPSQLTIEPHAVVLTCEDGSIELECPGGSAPQTPQYAEYEMELVNRQSTTVAWRSPRQAPAGGTQLSFTVQDPGSLAHGDYDLIVRGHSPDNEEVVARFWLRVD